MFLKTKYNWSKTDINDIGWKTVSRFTNNHYYAKNKTFDRYVHKFLISGGNGHGHKLISPHYEERDDKLVSRNHFLTYLATLLKNNMYITHIRSASHQIQTPKTIINIIINSIPYYYNLVTIRVNGKICVNTYILYPRFSTFS